MEEHKKCPNYKDCPNYNPRYKMCNETSGIVGNKTAKCWMIYEKFKAYRKA